MLQAAVGRVLGDGLKDERSTRSDVGPKEDSEALVHGKGQLCLMGVWIVTPSTTRHNAKAKLLAT